MDNSYGDPLNSLNKKIQIMPGSHTDLSETSSKCIECTCVCAIMPLLAFVFLITQYQTNQQLETELRTSRDRHSKLD